MLYAQQTETATSNKIGSHHNTNQSNNYRDIEHRAQKMGMELTDQRKEAIDFVLDFYEHCDDCKNARQLMNIMDQEFADKGGKKYLYRLFPNGPLSQIHELADLPNLSHQVDKGFGTSY